MVHIPACGDMATCQPRLRVLYREDTVRMAVQAPHQEWLGVYLYICGLGLRVVRATSTDGRVLSTLSWSERGFVSGDISLHVWYMVGGGVSTALDSCLYRRKSTPRSVSAYRS